MQVWKKSKSFECAVFFLIAASICTLLFCAKEESGELYIREGIDTEVDYPTLTDYIFTLEEKIRQEVSNQSLRLDLLQACVDTSVNVVRAVGQGETPLDARSRPIALQAAERAAFADANRWIGHILQWKNDYTQPDFGSLSAQIPALRIVYKDTLQNDTVVMLVETDIQ